MLSINTNTGVASTPSTPFDFLLGETTLNVEVSLAGAVLTDQARGSREILVLPDGTFRVVGAVTEADSPGQAVRDAILEVRLTEGLSSLPVARASTDATGRYRLYGVPAESYLHVRRPGYVSVTERTHVGSHTTRDSASQQTYPECSLEFFSMIPVGLRTTRAGIRLRALRSGETSPKPSRRRGRRREARAGGVFSGRRPRRRNPDVAPPHFTVQLGVSLTP